MDYFNHIRVIILCCILITINIIIIIFELTFKDLTQLEDTYISVGTSNETSGGIYMSTNYIDEESFKFEQKSKVETSLLKYVSDSYATTNFLDTMLIGKIIDVPFTNQIVKYPTGCESVSATSVLQYYGIDISIDSFIDDYLDKAKLTIIGYKANNEKVFSSMHPNEYFIGNPKSAYGLGCYENTIENAINKVLKDNQLLDYFEVNAHNDLSLDNVQEYIDNDTPVIIWTTQNLVSSEKGLKWYLGDSKEVFQYMKNEHCVVAIGYDDNYLYCNDSLVGRIAYPKILFEDRYNQMGTRTVTVEYVY